MWHLEPELVLAGVKTRVKQPCGVGFSKSDESLWGANREKAAQLGVKHDIQAVFPIDFYLFPLSWSTKWPPLETRLSEIQKS